MPFIERHRQISIELGVGMNSGPVEDARGRNCDLSTRILALRSRAEVRGRWRKEGMRDEPIHEKWIEEGMTVQEYVARYIEVEDEMKRRRKCCCRCGWPLANLIPVRLGLDGYSN